MENIYNNYWRERGKSGHRPRYDIFLDWMDAGSSALEFGSGDGYLGAYLKEKKSITYLATDISETAIAGARARGLETEVVNASDTDFLKKRFADKEFDYVIMTEFLEHIVNSEEVLMEAIRIARKAVLVSVPNSAYWRYRLQLLFGNFPKQWAVFPHEHVRFWSIADFLKTVGGLGLRVEKMKASNGKKVLRDIWPNLFGFQICYLIRKP
ncbi:MAG: hypothetical protein A3A33_01500 [Candidatus Yanofskybacteria bacterium RIFCSPLOWO2_01_FULL_49_25]|uniref:Methyltransferase type 11 domain-containing protein n=1 Tax=Candidatus Yanofskybacteria bacterium RIFCSPLOWO2_01_FULL_49_25 TaxID=1802701 RepID=A0A1F8GZT1_9BACT|nr:MAG: hypothetical protein A3A33_01500 [Candidatus Yanofskybacteria bacterium RIFCSPLOWO2_01_FULL_49_25]